MFRFICVRSRAPPSPILPPGVGSLYSPSASFQSLLANISAAQHSAHQSAVAQAAAKPPAPPLEYLSSLGSTSPPLSPPIPAATNLSNNAGIGNSSNGAASVSPPPASTAVATDDRRSSSIAALRLKAREHEMRLEMLRQNGHSDIIS